MPTKKPGDLGFKGLTSQPADDWRLKIEIPNRLKGTTLPRIIHPNGIAHIKNQQALFDHPGQLKLKLKDG